MNTDDFKLDNPVWYALTESHQDYAIDYGGVKFYHPDYCPFGGFTGGKVVAGGISRYAQLAPDFFVVGERPQFNEQVRLKNELVCKQMVIDHKMDAVYTETIIELRAQHMDELLHLVNLVQPGFFKRKTAELGRYYGIFKGNVLVAVTGERMRMNSFVEVSAVVTHPAHTGKGYALQLVAHTVNNIFDQGCVPCLHVVATNTPAIRLYEKCSFYTRRKISFWHFGGQS